MATIKICNILGDILLDIAPYIYGLYVTTDRKEIKKLINQFIDAIIETIVVSLLYYCKFCKTFKLNKFNINPYECCVANLLVNGLQQFILFCVNDCKLIHKDPKVNDSFIEVLRE